MPVRPPRRTDVGALVAALTSPDPVARDSAAARLVVFGRRGLAGLRMLIADGDASADSRAAALRVVSQIDRQAAVDLAVDAAASRERPLALEAVAVLGQELGSSQPAGNDAGERALEALTRLALDQHVEPELRRHAIDALAALPASVRRPLLQALAAGREADDGVGAATGAADGYATVLTHWSEDGRLPDTATVVQDALTEGAGDVPVTVLLRLLTLARARESDAADDQGEWALLRDQLHGSLATRGSVIGLFDLREALESMARPASTQLLAAAAVVADAGCLEPITVRWLAAGRDAWLRDQLERIFRAIVVRERLRRRSTVLVQLLKRHPSAGALVANAPRAIRATTRRPRP